MARIVETDNFGGDYPDEKFVNLPSLGPLVCQAICNLVNGALPDDHPRHYRVVPENYKLQPGFEP